MKMTKLCLWAAYASKIERDDNQHYLVLDDVGRCEAVTGLLDNLQQYLNPMCFWHSVSHVHKVRIHFCPHWLQLDNDKIMWSYTENKEGIDTSNKNSNYVNRLQRKQQLVESSSFRRKWASTCFLASMLARLWDFLRQLFTCLFFSGWKSPILFVQPTLYLSRKVHQSRFSPPNPNLIELYSQNGDLPFGTNHRAESFGAFESVGKVHPTTIFTCQLWFLFFFCQKSEGKIRKKRK